MSEEQNFEWELTFGFYKGILFGMRTYEAEDSNTHVFYLPFIDIAFKVWHT